MRYIVGSLTVLLLIVGITVWSSGHMAEITDRMMGYLDETEASSSPEEQLENLRHMEAYWEAQRGYLESVVVHNDLEDAGVTLSHLISAALCEDEDDFAAAIRLLRIQMEHIRRMEQLRLGNIL